ncbi:MAG: YdeI/OmpD-associated family protein [Bacteroidota bacterium]
MPDLQKIFVEDIHQLRLWLMANHSQKESFWLVKWKKGMREEFISYDELVDELICFGWVDSLPRKLDEEKTMLRISPRDPNSNWSKANKERVIRLTNEGKMEDSGLRLVEEAKRNGAWNFLDDVEKLIVPDDLAEAFRNDAKAKYYYERFPNSSKRGILEWIKNAKKATTRQKRILETVTKATQNIKANHPKGRDKGAADNK